MIVYLQGKDVTLDVPDDIGDGELADLQTNFSAYSDASDDAPTNPGPRTGPASQPQTPAGSPPAPATGPAPASTGGWVPNFYESVVKTMIPALGPMPGLALQAGETEEGRAFTGKFFEGFTFGLTKSVTPESMKEEYADHPVYAAAGELTGGIGSLLATGGAVKAAGLGVQAARAGSLAVEGGFAAGSRFIPPAIMSGATFGTKTFIDKTVQAFQDGNVNIVDFGESVIRDTALGTVLGGISGVTNAATAISSAAGLGFVSSKMEGADNTEAALNAGIWGIFEAVGSFGREARIRKDALNTLGDTIGEYVKAKNPKVTPETAKAVGDAVVAQAAGRVGGIDAVVESQENTLKIIEDINQKVRQGKIRMPDPSEPKPVEPPKLGAPEAPAAATPETVPVEPPPVEPQPVEPAIQRSEKPVKFDDSGLPIRKPGSVVSTINVGADHPPVKLRHQMVLDEAEGLLAEAKERRVASPLEEFVASNGGVKAYRPDETGKAVEGEEMRDVPVRFKRKDGLSVDEMAQMAYDEGLLPEPSGDMLRNQLKELAVRGQEPKLADFYDQAQRNLEEFFGGLGGEGKTAVNYSAAATATGEDKAALRVRAKDAANQVLRANKIDDRVLVNLVDHIVADDEAFKRGYGQDASPSEYTIKGETRTQKGNDRIEAVISLANGATEHTGRHEAFHAVTNILLEDAEKETLLNAFGNMENASDAFADYRSGATPPADSVIAKLFAKIKAFLARVKAYLTKEKFNTPEDIFQAVDKGKLAERAASGGKVTDPEYQAAYHGSPHHFEKFDIQKIGSGEGNQAFGWGLYFAGSKDVAKFYRDKLSGPTEYEVKYQGKTAPFDLNEDTLNARALRDIQRLGSKEKALQAAKQQIESSKDVYAADSPFRRHIEDQLKAIEAIDESQLEVTKRGALYEVDIPDDIDFVNYDRLIADHPKAIRNKLEALIKSLNLGISPYEATGEQFYEAIVQEFNDGYTSKSKLTAANPEGSPEENASRFLASRGIPGIKYFDQQSRGKSEGSSNYVLFDDKLVKVIDRQYQAEKREAFYSQVAKTIAEKMPAKAPADQIIGILKNAAGVKADELADLDLETWLKGQKGPVAKEAVLDFVKKGGVQVEEVVKGGSEGQIPAADQIAMELFGRPFSDLSDEEAVEVTTKVGDRRLDNFDAPGGITKFDKYTLPGGENYREILFTLPGGTGAPTADETAEHGKLAIKSKRSDQEEARYLELSKRLHEAHASSAETQFHSSHFSEPNVLAHVRFNERTDAQGKKTLFIEEVQSDWHQKGRDVGYKSDRLPEGYSVQKDNEGRFVVVTPNGIALRGTLTETAQKAKTLFNDLQFSRAVKGEAVPDAPFKKTWHELALKRMVRWAADNGFDQIAWTTGAQQAERYDLSKSISRMWYVDEKLFAWGLDGETVIQEAGVTPEMLPDFIGKEAAQKILATTPTDGGIQRLDGMEVKVGGEGMKGFYDQMIPSFLNKYTKKWGGRVGEAVISTSIPKSVTKAVRETIKGLDNLGFDRQHDAIAAILNHADFATRWDIPEDVAKKLQAWKSSAGQTHVHALEITPAMKDAVLGGQPLYSATPNDPGLFGDQPGENVGDRYQRLRSEALERGMTPAQASKWAKEKIKAGGMGPAPAPDAKPKQEEFGAGGGVQGFGQGREGEQEFFNEEVYPSTKGGGRQYGEIGDEIAAIKKKIGGLEFIKKMRGPELVKLAKAISGEVPVIKKIMKALGYFRPGDEEIALRADLFKDQQLWEAVLAHEIGHLMDFNPDKTMSRGNVLGRIASLRSYRQTLLPEGPDSTEKILTDKDRAHFQAEAERMAKGEGEKSNSPDREFDPQAVLDVWNNVTGTIDPDLLEYIKNIDVEKKKSLIKSAMAAMKKGEKITVVDINKFNKDAKADFRRVADIYRDLLKKEIKKRKLWENEVVNEEMKNLSQYWKPFDPFKSRRFTAYRFSPAELYADFVSVLLNAPAKAKQLAPNSYDAFFNYLQNKPDVMRDLIELQTLIQADDVDLQKVRGEDILAMFDKGEQAFRARQANIEAANKSMWDKLRVFFWDKNSILLDERNKLNKREPLPPETDAKYAIEKNTLMSNFVRSYLEDFDRLVYKPSKDAAVLDEVKTILFLDRIGADRSDLANPLGHTPETAKAFLDHMQKTDPARYEKASELATAARKWFRDISAIPGKEDFFTPQQLFVMDQNPKYAPFRVVDYMRDYMSAGMAAQIGTFKDIGDPLTSLAMKGSAVVTAIERNRLKKIIGEMLLKSGTPMRPAKVSQMPGQFHIEDPMEQHLGTLAWKDGGKWVAYHVDRYIADVFNAGSSENMSLLGATINTILNNNVFRGLYITFNVTFQSANLIRDFMRAWKNTPGLTLPKAIRLYVKSIPEAKARAGGHYDPLIQEMERNGALQFTLNDLILGKTSEDEELEAIFQKFDIIESPESRYKDVPILKQITAIMDFIRYTGDVVETIPKVVGWKALEHMSDEERAYFVRNLVGTPNYSRKGTASPVTNTVFMFSNIIKEGYRGFFEAAFQNQKTRHSYWTKTFMTTILPKLAMAMGAAGAFGLGYKRVMDKASEYHKSNYIVIPLGVDGEDNGVYVTIPQDEDARFIGAMFWKILHHEGSLAKNLTDIFAFWADQLPSVAPALSIAKVWTEYLSGGNPRDAFRDQDILTEQERTAGGKYSFEPMARWTLNQTGLVRLDIRDRLKDEPLYKTILAGTPILQRFLRVGRTGEREAVMAAGQPIKQEQARKSLDVKAAAREAIRQGQNEIEFSREATTVEDARQRRQAYANQKKGFTDDPFVQALNRAQSSEEKTAILKEARDLYHSSGDFNDYVDTLYMNKVIPARVALEARE